jgi:hypothetical protein
MMKQTLLLDMRNAMRPARPMPEPVVVKTLASEIQTSLSSGDNGLNVD